MKNIVNYLDEYSEEHVYENSKNRRIGMKEYIKANRKASREEEIAAYGHPINHNRVWKSKKDYNRKQKHKKQWE